MEPVSGPHPVETRHSASGPTCPCASFGYTHLKPRPVISDVVTYVMKAFSSRLQTQRLRAREDGHDLGHASSRIGSVPVAHRRRTAELADDILLDACRLAADDGADLVALEVLEDAVHDDGLQHQANDAVDAHAGPIEGDTRSGHHGVNGGHGVSHRKARVPSKGHNQNLRPAGRRAGVVGDGIAQRDEKDRAAEVNPHVPRERFRHGHDRLEN